MKFQEDLEQHLKLQLPEASERLENLKLHFKAELLESLWIHEQAFKAYPELQKIISNNTKDLIVDALAECYVMLNLDEYLPEFFAYRKTQDDGLPENIMWINFNSEDNKDLTLGINFNKLFDVSKKLEEKETQLSSMNKGDLRRIVAHEVHHVWDVVNHPERAKRSGIANARSDMAFLDEGENAADQFGFYYRNLKDKQEAA